MVMPSKSKKQQNFMAAVANNPKFAKKAGVPQSVGKDYEKADKMKGMKKYQRGGPMPASPMPAGMANPQAGVTGVATPPPSPRLGTMQQEYTRLGGESAEEARARGEAGRAQRARRARRAGGGPRSGRGGMKKGGKVRGAGCATKGTRAAKMVTMKGA